MAYDTGNFSLFNESQNYTTIFADLKAPAFRPNATLFGTLWASYIAPKVATTGTGSIGTLYGQYLAPILTPTSGTVSLAYSLNVSGPSISTGTLKNAYSLYVTPSSGAGTIVNNFTAYFGGATGIGTTTPQNFLDVRGGVAVGTFAGVFTAPPNGLIVSGQIGVNTSTPAATVDVQGIASATHILAPGATRNIQNVGLFEGNNQGGFGGGSVGTFKTLSQNTVAYFNTTTLPSLSSAIGTNGLLFDGRFVYFVPNFGGTDQGQFVRYDTTLSFSATTSYALFDMPPSVQSNSFNFQGGVFDGRYIYLVPFTAGSGGQVTRYDITLPFTASSSYAVYDMAANVNSGSHGFVGGLFDGRYVYFTPYTTGVLTRYDTTLSFSSSASYSAFTPTASIQSCYGGTFDGRYLYWINTSTGSGSFVQYDTTSTFASNVSYNSFNTQTNVNSLSEGFASCFFDGRYVYLVPYTNSLTVSGQITRYDTTLPFGTATSYAIFDAYANVNSNCQRYFGGLFDGRYAIFNPSLNGQVLRYDTTQSFTSASSYSTYNVAAGNAGATTFIGSVSDGRYYYAIGQGSAVVVRFDVYPGSQATAISAYQAANGFTIGTYAGTAPPTNGLILPGNVGIGVSSPAYTLDVTGGVVTATRVYTSDTTANNQRVGLFEGNNQGGFGGGFVGTNKTMSQNTTLYFDTTTVNTNSKTFAGGVFDGRYIYLVPNNGGLITRYDTTLSFSVSTSYAVFDSAANLNSNSGGFEGGIFDGRYVYFVPNLISAYSGQITRYDTTLSFSVSTSYALFDTRVNVNSYSAGFAGGVFDGRYVYLIPYFNGTTYSGQITRYDTTLGFSASTSYAFFDTRGSVNSNSAGFDGGVFDGRYVYLSPFMVGATASGQITRYDTTLPFGTATSYAIFDTQANVNSNSAGFVGGIFDGRYVYLVPYSNVSNFGQITRYDTTLPFGTATSYAIFDTQANLNSNSVAFLGGVFDGRYVYLAPNFLGQVTRYDTTLAFTVSSSYTLFNTRTANSKSAGFLGCVFDGRYVYLVPYSFGTITRLDAYPGPQATAMTAAQAANGFVIGSYIGTAPPSGGLIVPGSIGVGVSSPAYTLDATGGVVSATRIYTSDTTANNQRVGLFEGNNQGGIGSGSVGTNKTMSQNTTQYFDTQAININSTGFIGGVFDGRYVYFVPQSDVSGSSGQITRYDTTLPFATTSSYAIFDTAANVNSNSLGFAGGIFDGRYVYLVPYYNEITYFGQITRYDTTLPFGVSTSYAVFDTKTYVNSNSGGFLGGVFDGRYVYLVPFYNGITSSGQITRYDTTLPFGVSTSYAVFDTKTYVNSNSGGFFGGVFDGRYVYLVPEGNTGAYSGQIIQYDTTLPFATATSYAFFDTGGNVNSYSSGFAGGVFDGRYVYLVPYYNGVTYSGQITRYDTTLPFATATSYAVFDTRTNVNSNSAGFQGGLFDGRYIYFVPYTANGTTYSGQITRYDTTQSFTAASSFTVFNTAAANAGSLGFSGGVFDGRYVYLVPLYNGSAYFGQITRIDAYPGPLATSIVASQAANGFAIGSVYGGLVTAPSNGLIVSGNVGIGVSSPAAALDVTGGVISATRVYAPGSTTNNQLVGLAQGNNQGSYGSGSVGLNKTMSQNTTQYFDTTTVNTNSKGFIGGVFDGRYVYLVPNNAAGSIGQITRYDTTLSFSVSTSYAIFDTQANVNSNSRGFEGAVFDGRYVYLVPNNNSTSGQITRYDTTLSFGVSTSYAVFDTKANVNSKSAGFIGGVYDGRYVYLVPNNNGSSVSGQITRYDTTLGFSASTSYAFFDTKANVNSNSAGFDGGVFDGRYVYFIPSNNGVYSGQITRYDTTLTFGTAASYAIFDTLANVNSNSAGFAGGVFDGRYIYLVPYYNGANFGQITRYDTTLPFGTAASYAVFDTLANVNSNSAVFAGGLYDGRYVYLVPYNQGQVTRYDTTLVFTAPSSYTIFNTKTANTNSTGFIGGVFDGRYFYLVPFAFGTLTRLDAYPGPQATAILASQAGNGFSIGTGVGAPLNGLLVSGNVGIGVSSPAYALDVGTSIINATRTYMNGTTFNNQLFTLAEGNSQSGFGGSSVGLSKTMSVNNTQAFDTKAQVNSNSCGFRGSVFDGRYLYFAPYANATLTGFSGQITRYDTALPFSSSASYLVFNTQTNVNSRSVGFSGAVYDGRYVYFVPYGGAVPLGQITRYDTTLSFLSSSSYAVFDTSTISAASVGFSGAVFDGRFLYLVPNNNGTSGQITQYDTTLPFSSSNSYAVFDTATIIGSSIGYNGGVYDGRYVYLVPNDSSTSGQILQYDTTLPFGTTTSYALFNTTLYVNSNSAGFFGGVFDGRFIYLVPLSNNGTPFGQITRYDTTASFSTSTSYAVFDTAANVNSLSQGFTGGLFDGRYVYLVPSQNTQTIAGQITRYDTTLPFTSASSYSVFDTRINVSSASSGFIGGSFDGRYIYFTPYVNSVSTTSGQITRIDAYPGQQATAIAASQAPNGFSIGSYAGTQAFNNLIVGGSVGAGTTTPTVPFTSASVINAQQQVSAVSGTTRVNQNVQVFEGYSQGSFGSALVGTQKTMSQNTTQYFNSSVNLNSNSLGFMGSVFDGRYLYLVPNSYNGTLYLGQITRFDTTLSFLSSASYTVFDTAANVSGNSKGFVGGVFDGRYIYLVPNYIGGAYSGQITRYDTSLNFSASSSYAVFDTSANVNPFSRGFNGAVFDGRYVYLVPYFSGSFYAGQITRFDTTLSFTSPSSYAVFDTTTVQSNSRGFEGGVFDGRYVYLVPNYNGTTAMGQITQYDTTLSFTSVGSYAVFDTAANVNSNSRGFYGGVFDGRFIYLIPFNNGTFFGQITRYDTTLPFGAISSYAVFDTVANVNGSSSGFNGGIFDGRYLYLVPNTNPLGTGQVTRYDTTLPFTSAGSYSIFNTAAGNSNSVAFTGGSYDGRYVYLVSSGFGTRSYGVLTRLDAYAGPQSTALNAAAAPNGLTLQGGGTFVLTSTSTTNTGIAGTAAALPTQVAGYLEFTINGTVQKIPYYNV